jgi:hypothetical protein
MVAVGFDLFAAVIGIIGFFSALVNEGPDLFNMTEA